MAGPKAPKDPTKKGSYFYICRQKSIAGSPQPDGRGIQFIYLNDVRLVTFARMAGNITDEHMIEQLRSAAGFREMVAGIGVSVDAPKLSDEIDFVFQMYGKTDPNHSGTTLRGKCVPDGMEKIFWLDDYEWSEDDDIPGQIRFEFPKAEQIATVDIRLYLREGYEAPEQEELHPIDKESADYKAILERSLMQTGDNTRLKAFLEKAKRGKDVTVAFIGGSITQGAGAIPITTESYAYKTWEGIRGFLAPMTPSGTGENIHLIKAGVGGTSSEFGMIRFERDVQREGTVQPDLVVIEYAVNDEGDETKGLCYESLTRKCLALKDDEGTGCAVLLLFAVFADDFNLQERLGPVGVRYKLPCVSIKDGVTEQFYKPFGQGRVLSKSQFFYDSYHPSNIGHTIMADSILNLIRTVDAQEATEVFDWRSAEPVFGTDFENVRLLDRHTNSDKMISVEPGDFDKTDRQLQAVEMDAEYVPVPEFPYNWHHVSGSGAFRMQIACRSLLMVSKDSGELIAGKAECYVDGKKVLTADPREVGWTHCNAQILINEKESALRNVEIRMASGDEEKQFTILGFGFVE